MSQILSQDEVDALLQGIGAGEVETAPETPPEALAVEEQDQQPPQPEYPRFDFTSQDRVVRGNMPGLEMVHDKFARAFRSTIGAATRRSIDVNVLSQENVKFSEFMRTVPLPSSLHIFKMDPLKGLGVCIMEGRLVFAFIDHFFGGHGRGHVKMEGRDFTPIEQRIVRMVIDMVLHDYQNAWSSVIPANITHIGSEVNPQFVNVVTGSDSVIGVNMEVELEESVGRLKFCLPFSMLEPIRDKLKSGVSRNNPDEASRSWTSNLKDNLGESSLELAVELGSMQISGRDLMQLKRGDIIPLNQDQYTPLTMYVEKIPKFQGRLGKFRGNHALKITKVMPRKGD
ncbi:flagellar motor switch protein FliM [Candidatus Sumerlaeota bacterium]|nr:flagellar motor switch protein FliM [Candidatus Sumerlaeota bacterium]